jgi:hypothetical protein
MMMEANYLVDGVVVDTADPQEMGRIKVWIPGIDGGDIDLDTIPWAKYVSPLAGFTTDFPAGGIGAKSTGQMAYGMWAIPKVGANVLIAFLYGDFNQRIYLGSFFSDFGNRSLPAGRNSDGAPQTDSFESIEPTTSNLKAQFQNNLSSSIARTRGAYERQVAQASTIKTTAEGYDQRVVPASELGAGDLDPQTYCITTPGRHAIILQDNPKVRIKTAEGHQVIFDDANERIYVSTSRGRSWFEMDVDGHVHVYGAESISMSAGADFNIQAKGSVNISAGKDINIGASGSLRASACSDLSLTGSGVNLTSTAGFNILASGDLIQTGSNIHLNGPTASTAPCPGAPSLTPSHEPWTRPEGKTPRNKNYRA